MASIVSPRTASDGAVKTVLLVEDDTLLRMILAEALHDSGFGVVEAGDADEARNFLGRGEPVDLVLTDINMPGSMNGIDLARWLKTHLPQLKIMLTSGAHWSNKVASIGSFIAKPFSIEEVVAQIHAVLSGHGPD